MHTKDVTVDPREAFPGGQASVDMTHKPNFRIPAANLDSEQRMIFYTGHSFAKNPWIAAPASTTARDGLGPLFNARSCMSCHVNGGRGRTIHDSDEAPVSLLVRLSIPADNTSGEHKDNLQRLGVVPEPVYGTQVQVKGLTSFGVQGEALPVLNWKFITGHYVDGKAYELRRPEIMFEQLAYGDMHPQTQISLRMAPALAGMGLLEAIPEAAVIAQVDEEDKDNNGISGRPNWVWSITKKQTVLGRFGWKASQPTVVQQTASALHNDMGITSLLFPDEVCSERQTACGKAPNGNGPSGTEIEAKLLSAMTLFTESLALPARGNWNDLGLLEGKKIFHSIQCSACHTPAFITSNNTENPALGNQAIWPYSDLLLHDMGEGLADNRNDFAANGREWRTAPLWGLNVAKRINPDAAYLHDGRARTLAEAILWHGGEAHNAREAFKALREEQRASLINFIESL